jgi:hypothetical protein
VKGSVARDTMYRGVWGIGFPLALLNHRVAWVCADDKSKGRMDLACFLENVQISCFNIPRKQTLRSIFAVPLAEIPVVTHELAGGRVDFMDSRKIGRSCFSDRKGIFCHGFPPPAYVYFSLACFHHCITAYFARQSVIFCVRTTGRKIHRDPLHPAL